MSWQPITTAPKDGTSVWVWSATRGAVVASNSGNGWYGEDGRRLRVQPTHWMPLESME